MMLYDIFKKKNPDLGNVFFPYFEKSLARKYGTFLNNPEIYIFFNLISKRERVLLKKSK